MGFLFQKELKKIILQKILYDGSFSAVTFTKVILQVGCSEINLKKYFFRSPLWAYQEYKNFRSVHLHFQNFYFHKYKFFAGIKIYLKDPLKQLGSLYISLKNIFILQKRRFFFCAFIRKLRYPLRDLCILPYHKLIRLCIILILKVYRINQFDDNVSFNLVFIIALPRQE